MKPTRRLLNFLKYEIKENVVENLTFELTKFEPTTRIYLHCLNERNNQRVSDINLGHEQIVTIGSDSLKNQAAKAYRDKPISIRLLMRFKIDTKERVMYFDLTNAISNSVNGYIDLFKIRDVNGVSISKMVETMINPEFSVSAADNFRIEIRTGNLSKAKCSSIAFYIKEQNIKEFVSEIGE